MSNTVYDILKWGVMIFLPALATLYAALGAIWGFPYIQEITTTITAITAFLGTVLGISSMQYSVKERTEDS